MKVSFVTFKDSFQGMVEKSKSWQLEISQNLSLFEPTNAFAFQRQ